MQDFYLNNNAVFSCLFVAVFASVAVYLIVRRLRPKFAIKVNCWFCNKDSTVPYGNRNCWDCPFCEQYNGFDENEDYNKPIPAQYDELLNHSSRWESEKESPPAAINGLCETCNDNQLLKIKQLAAFVPQNDKFFDTEVELFKRQLDSAYKLCYKCEVFLHQKLGKQDSTLRGKVLSWKIQQQQKQRPYHTKAFIGVPKFVRVLQLSSLSIITFVCVQSINVLQNDTKEEILPLHKIIPRSILTDFAEKKKWICGPEFSLLGFFLLIGAILSAGKNRLRVLDAFTCFTWLVMLFLQLPIIPSLFPSKEARVITQYIFSFFGAILTAGCIFCCRPQSVVGGSWKHKGSNSHKSFSDVSNYYPSSDDQTSILDDNLSEKCIPQFSGTHSNVLQDCKISTTTLGKMSSRNSTFESALDSHLQAMKISTPKKSQNISGVFTKRVYSSQSLTSLSSSSSSSTFNFQRNVLSPARLKAKTIAHSSWVGGGYWANANPHHSRLLSTAFPSGQFSRGFYRPPNSSFSCPASRDGSVIGDDGGSVYSDPGHLRKSFPFSERSCRNSLSPVKDLEQSANDSDQSRSLEEELGTPINVPFSQQFTVLKKDSGFLKTTSFKFFLGFSIANLILICYVCFPF